MNFPKVGSLMTQANTQAPKGLVSQRIRFTFKSRLFVLHLCIRQEEFISNPKSRLLLGSTTCLVESSSFDGWWLCNRSSKRHAVAYSKTCCKAEPQKPTEPTALRCTEDGGIRPLISAMNHFAQEPKPGKALRPMSGTPATQDAVIHRYALSALSPLDV